MVVLRTTSDANLSPPGRRVLLDACMVLAYSAIPACHATALQVVIGALLAPERSVEAVAVETQEAGVNLS